jgi:hypothetical protein
MQTDEREVAQVVIERDIGAPTFRSMTLLAIFSEMAAMHILRSMTVVARCAQLLFPDFGGMAGVAVDACVFSRERKLGIARVIELVRLPCARIVAFSAVHTESRCVEVVGRMTAVTLLRQRVLHAAGFVAFQAIDTGVCTVEREFCFL